MKVVFLIINEMTIWELETDSGFTAFPFSLEEDRAFFHKLIESHFTDLKPASGIWYPIYLQRDFPMKLPDFFEIDNTGIIAISQTALKQLNVFFNNKIELLPVETDAGKYYVLNVLNFVDCLDKESSKFSAARNGTIVSYTLLEFSKEKIGNNVIFRIPELPYKTFITDDFQDICEQENLQGLLFDPEMNLIWYPE
jgi:hypothetical protein